MATLALLQASIVAVSSDSLSLVSGNPPENKTTIFRPGTPRRFLARLRMARSMLRAPKSAAAFVSEEDPMVGPAPSGVLEALEATVTGSAALGSTAEFFTPETAARSKLALAVKFWTILSVRSEERR